MKKPVSYLVTVEGATSVTPAGIFDDETKAVEYGESLLQAQPDEWHTVAVTMMLLNPITVHVGARGLPVAPGRLMGTWSWRVDGDEPREAFWEANEDVTTSAN